MEKRLQKGKNSQEDTNRREKGKHAFASIRNLVLGFGAIGVAGAVSNSINHYASANQTYFYGPEKPAIVEYVETARTIRNNFSNDLQGLNTPQGVPYPTGAFIDLLKEQREQERREKAEKLETSLIALDEDIGEMEKSPQIQRFQTEINDWQTYHEVEHQQIEEVHKRNRPIRIVGLLGALALFGKAFYHYNKADRLNRKRD